MTRPGCVYLYGGPGDGKVVPGLAYTMPLRFYHHEPVFEPIDVDPGPWMRTNVRVALYRPLRFSTERGVRDAFNRDHPAARGYLVFYFDRWEDQ